MKIPLRILVNAINSPFLLSHRYPRLTHYVGYGCSLPTATLIVTQVYFLCGPSLHNFLSCVNEGVF